jgi:hypothetical protein
MSDDHDARTEELLRRHLAETLDPHLGAAERFKRSIAAASPIAPSVAPFVAPPKARRKEPHFGSLWTIGLIGTALAATITIVSMRHAAEPLSRPAHPALPVTPVASAEPVLRNAEWNTVDQGLVELDDGTPARQLLQRRTDKVEWYDAKRKAYIEYTVPREQTVLVGLNKY